VATVITGFLVAFSAFGFLAVAVAGNLAWRI